MNDTPRKITLIIALILILGSITYLESKKARPSAGDIDIETVAAPDLDSDIASSTATSTTASGATAVASRRAGFKSVAEKSSRYSLAKEITTPDGFINTGGLPIKISDYVGKKVVLIDFFTYSCINCQRTTPYLNAWYDKYEDEGLVIIGVHTPEFEFEKNYDNVKAAIAKMGIKFPVALDNDFSTWTAYENRYWPHKYLIDIDGYVAYDHIGEGGYDETEQRIQEALKERAAVLGTKQVISGGIVTPATVGSIQAGSNETYFGSERNEYLGNGISGVSGEEDYVLPKTVMPNTLYLGGHWNIQPEYAEAADGSTILYRYTAKHVYIVASSNATSTLTILEDGTPTGTVEVGPATLYELVSHPSAETHTLEIKIKGSDLETFTFTFG